jgi:CysZ protein
MIEGLRAVAGGIGFIIITPRVWPYALVPALMMTLLLCGLMGFAAWGAHWSTWALVGEPEGVWGQIGGWLLDVLLVLVAVFIAALLAIALAQPLSGFALEAVARAQERALLGRNVPHTSFWNALWTSTRATAVMLILGGFIYTALFVVDLCFPPMVAVTVPARFIAGGWLLAWNFLDYPLSLRGLGVWARLSWAFRHFDEFTVFGLTWAALLFVPGLFFVILPMGVAGATRLVVEAEERDAYELAEGDALPRG